MIKNISRIPTKEEEDRLKKYEKKNKLFIDKRSFIKNLSPYLFLYNERWNYPDEDKYSVQEKNVVRNSQLDLVGVIGSDDYLINYFIDAQIAPELICDNKKICSIGFSNKTNKWYGWSHRAIQGFNIGHTVKKGDINYKSKDLDEIYQSVLDWYKYSRDTTRIMKFNDCVSVEIMVEEAVGLTETNEYIYREGWYKINDIYPGKGEWTAKTLDDCKQMAIDFAIAVR